MKDLAIIGGGLAGLSLANLLAEKYDVVLIEKERYPFHKVCGEYISNESRPFLESLGIPFDEWRLPEIHELLLSAPSGLTFTSPLELGGFGISRYKLDAFLAVRARSKGVEVLEGSKVEQVRPTPSGYQVATQDQTINARLVIGAQGKRSNLDKSLNRPFMQKRTDYIGVKYHIQTDLAQEHQIALHNFSGGYCGMSKVEDNRVCLCYLALASDLKKEGSLQGLEEKVLRQNPHLDQIFKEAEFLYKEPLVISQISFADKDQIKDGIPMVGDASGLITPLCGNGMSMAMHGAYLMAPLLQEFLDGRLTKQELTKSYATLWKRNFKKRLDAGRVFQKLFGAPWLTSAFMQSVKPFPAVQQKLIRLTHGQDFYGG